MRVLLIYPRFPKSFWSFDKTLELAGHKALMPPLGIITVAALLPQAWEFRLVDRNVRMETQADWDWAELVLLSGMIVQKDDMLHIVRAAKAQGKLVAVGGPYVTSVPAPLQAAGADFLILDEGEITLPMFVEAINRGETSGIFRATEKPDVTATPIPRFDLLDLSAYSDMSVQFSRGCPFQCEFCDIIVLYGRKPRTKSPQQLVAELQTLYDIGWRGSVFMVDDNFIGNKRNVKLLLRALEPWQAARGYPFYFSTEASVNLAEDRELLDLMVACNFSSVFLGIETPDTDSLALTQKFQNTRNSLVEAVNTISHTGIRVMAGFIIGFDHEKTGAGRRIIDFVEVTGIPQALFSMLQVLPNTALWHRLQKEGRLIEGNDCGNINQTTLLNFVPTRPIAEIAREYIECFRELYDPKKYLARVYRHHVAMAPRTYKTASRRPTWATLRALAIICWRQGIKRNTRVQFWWQLFALWRRNPSVLKRYFVNCAHLEHFLDYREIVTEQIEAQLAKTPLVETVMASNATSGSESRRSRTARSSSTDRTALSKIANPPRKRHASGEGAGMALAISGQSARSLIAKAQPELECPEVDVLDPDNICFNRPDRIDLKATVCARLDRLWRLNDNNAAAATRGIGCQTPDRWRKVALGRSEVQTCFDAAIVVGTVEQAGIEPLAGRFEIGRR